MPRTADRASAEPNAEHLVFLNLRRRKYQLLHRRKGRINSPRIVPSLRPSPEQRRSQCLLQIPHGILRAANPTRPFFCGAFRQGSILQRRSRPRPVPAPWALIRSRSIPRPSALSARSRWPDARDAWSSLQNRRALRAERVAHADGGSLDEGDSRVDALTPSMDADARKIIPGVSAQAGATESVWRSLYGLRSARATAALSARR